MQKSDLKILIVEDDSTLGNALKEAITRAGYKALLCTKPDDALATVKLQQVHAAVIDCMLPRMNGRDLALKLRQEVSKDLPIILTSGIYKDKQFAKEAIQSTGAVAFLTKPFDMDHLLQNIETKLAHLVDIPLLPIYDLLTKPKLTAKERVKAINGSDPVQGFDLPWIYSLLMDPKISGHLNIINADGEVAGVGISQGHIVNVNLQDTQSYFGVLLVEKGFISSAELEETLAGDTRNKKVGERLVDANVLSPHAVNIVIAEQLGIRLSKTVSNNSLKVNFIDSGDIRTDASLDRAALIELLDNWIASKIPLEWLKAFYMPWMNFVIGKGAEFSDIHRGLTLPLLGRMPGFLKDATAGTTLDQLLSTSKYSEELVYRGFHFLLLSRLICFGEQRSVMDFGAHKRRLEKLNVELDAQTYFERLGVSQKAKDNEIKRAYHELAKVLHPDKLSPDTPADIRDLTRDVFSKLSVAYETLSDVQAKANYLKELEQGRAELILQAESLADQGKVFLNKGDAKKALQLLEEAVRLAPPTSELRLLLVWARIKNLGTKTKDIAAEADFKDQLSQIPPEDRHNATYYFIKGLVLRYSGELEHARKSLEHACAIEPGFIDARRELNVLKLQIKGNNKPTNILQSDLKDVVGMLFKKKK